jgi:hypothetical protein
MTWETRQRGGKYYTRSRRIEGRVVREYVGGGPAGEIAARMDTVDRAQREHQREEWLTEEHEYAELDRLIEQVDRAYRSMMKTALERAGYYQHNRGEWRKRRG